jgi:hypothetical protein
MKILARRLRTPVPAQHDVYTTEVSIAVGTLRKREQINHRNRGHDPLLQVSFLPADVAIAVGALRKREQINRRNRGRDPLLQLLFSSVGEPSSINLHNLLAIGQKCSTLSCNKNSDTEE